MLMSLTAKMKSRVCFEVITSTDVVCLTYSIDVCSTESIVMTNDEWNLLKSIYLWTKSKISQRHVAAHPYACMRGKMLIRSHEDYSSYCHRFGAWDPVKGLGHFKVSQILYYK